MTPSKFEEYSWPGGFPAVANIIMMPSLKLDRFMNLLNQNLSMVTNLVFAFEQKLLGGKNSPYPFDQDEMKRFDIKKKLELAKR